MIGNITLAWTAGLLCLFIFGNDKITRMTCILMPALYTFVLLFAWTLVQLSI